MRRRFSLGVLVILVLAVVSLPAASASSSQGGSSAGDENDVEVIRVTAKPVSEVFLDLDKSGGESLGDQVVFSSDFFKGDEKIGFDGGFCTLVREPALYQCVATNFLPRGQLTAQGLLDFAEGGPFHLAITGGTRKYRTAHGEVKVVDQADTDRVTFRILR